MLMEFVYNLLLVDAPIILVKMEELVRKMVPVIYVVVPKVILVRIVRLLFHVANTVARMALNVKIWMI